MEQESTQAGLDQFLGVESEGSKSRWKVWLVIGGFAIIALLAAWYAFSGSETKAYATAQVTKGDLEVKVSATGNLAPTNQVSVGSELSGTVETVLVDVNDRVVRGQPLAQIDTSRLRDAIARSRAALEQAQAGVGQAEASLRQTSANLGRLQEVYRLSGGKVPSRLELDNAAAERDRAAGNLRAAHAAVASAQAQMSSDNTNLAKATIRSPVTGVVLSRQIEPGQTVAASFNTPTLFTIAEDLSAMELDVKVDEADVGQVKESQPASFSVDAFPSQKFPARIVRVNLGSNSTSSSSSSGSSTVVSYSAVLAVSNPDLILRPGMTATASILVNKATGVLLVPNSALRFQPTEQAKSSGVLGMGMPPPRRSQKKSTDTQIGRGTKQTLYRLDDSGKPVAIEVTAGASNGGQTVVTGPGLSSGMTVITGELAAAK